VIVSTLITLAGPALVRYAIDAGISKHSAARSTAAAAAFLSSPGESRCRAPPDSARGRAPASRFLGSLRTATFDKLQALPLGFFERERAGVLVSRLTSDVQSLTEFIRGA